MSIKAVVSIKGSIRKFFAGDGVLSGTQRDVHFMHNDDVEAYVKMKLLSGHECAILSAEQFAFNELVPTFTKP